MVLTFDEVAERERWKLVKEKYMMLQILDLRCPQAEGFLNLQVLQPVLNSDGAQVFDRSVLGEPRADRKYSKAILPWNIEDIVVNFTTERELEDLGDHYISWFAIGSSFGSLFPSTNE
jgi:hypothetical protein